MIFNEISFHDSHIMQVKENPAKQTLDFFIDFPTDWENNIFEHKILRFENVTFYSLEEIPFDGLPTILNINDLGEITKDFSTSNYEWIIVRNKIEIQTNAGNRIIEFSNCTFI
ncbi:hypothetical protein PQ459_09725 [Chryseobacterium sp. KACC 21268]|nr:hypothetical protein PQ459_09725 [Chryseobacterium sp. KACC 21268]